MKTPPSRRQRSITTNLSLALALLICIGCDSANEPAKSPSTDDASSQAESSGQEPSSEQEDFSPRADNAGTQDKASGSDTNTKEESASSVNPPTAAKSPAMSAEAFLMAAGEGRTEDVKRALDSGMSIEAAEPGRAHTAPHHAAYNGHTATVLFLIKQGATLDCRDHEGKTPLIHACTGPFPETVQALIKAGADVNAKGTAEGFTPLMMAAGLDQLKSVHILLENGANKEAVDEDNDKAIDHARRAGLTEIVQVLQ